MSEKDELRTGTSKMFQKFKTKVEKHAFDDEKRRESLKRRLREQQSQKNLIISALADSSGIKSKKIVFDDEIVSANEGTVNGDIVTSERESPEKPRLFEESDSDKEENYEINIKSQFEGKKGQKLLHLQSSYNNDERFRLDERFHDDDDEDDEVSEENNSLKSESNALEDEKAKQFKILESVLGHSVQSTLKTGNKPKTKLYEMVRFDASNEEHKRQEDGIVQEEETEVKKKKKKKLDKEERKKRRKEEAEKNEKSEASLKTENKFYEVSNDLKVALKNRKSENGQFSLLEAFSRKYDVSEEATEKKELDESEDNCEEEEPIEERVNFDNRVDNNDSKETAESGKVQGIKREKFFFVDDDPRIEEGLNFINMKNSEEAGKVIENYDKTRGEIRERLRLRWQKHRQRKNPFKKKIGGSNRERSKFNKMPRGKTVNGRKHY